MPDRVMTTSMRGRPSSSSGMQLCAADPAVAVDARLRADQGQGLGDGATLVLHVVRAPEHQGDGLGQRVADSSWRASSAAVWRCPSRIAKACWAGGRDRSRAGCAPWAASPWCAAGRRPVPVHEAAVQGMQDRASSSDIVGELAGQCRAGGRSPRQACGSGQRGASAVHRAFSSASASSSAACSSVRVSPWLDSAMAASMSAAPPLRGPRRPRAGRRESAFLRARGGRGAGLRSPDAVWFHAGSAAQSPGRALFLDQGGELVALLVSSSSCCARQRSMDS
jgi:hypothetical protein